MTSLLLEEDWHANDERPPEDDAFAPENPAVRSSVFELLSRVQFLGGHVDLYADDAGEIERAIRAWARDCNARCEMPRPRIGGYITKQLWLYSCDDKALATLMWRR